MLDGLALWPTAKSSLRHSEVLSELELQPFLYETVLLPLNSLTIGKASYPKAGISPAAI